VAQPDWQKIDVPAGGNFIGWGNKDSQTVIGKVLTFTLTGGTDFNDNDCPQLELELVEDASSFDKGGNETVYGAGDLVTLTCGLVRLNKAVRKAGLQTGDLVKIVMTGTTDIGGGKGMKEFDIYTIPGGGKKGTAVRAVKSEEPDF
jgi:hypothetical protein